MMALTSFERGGYDDMRGRVNGVLALPVDQLPMDRDVAAPPSVEAQQFTLVRVGNGLMKYRRVKIDFPRWA